MTSFLSNFKNFIWDWNGTLLDDADACVEIMNLLLAEASLPPLTKDKYLHVFTFPVYDYYIKLGFPADSFQEMSFRYIRKYEQLRPTLSLHPNASELLQKLSASGGNQAVLSAYSITPLKEALRERNILGLFVEVAGLDNIYAQSKLEIGKNMMEKLNWAPSETLLIGDTIHDYEVARELGAKCAMVAHGHNHHSRLSSLGVPVFHSFEELL